MLHDSRDQNVGAVTDGISSDYETVTALIRTLRRDIDNQIDLMSQNQIQQVRGLLFQLSYCQRLYSMAV